MHPTLPIGGDSTGDNREAPITKPSVDPRSFDYSRALTICRVIFSSEIDDEPGMCEVIGYSRKRDRTVTFNVLFENRSEDPFPVNAKDMMGMLEDNLYFPA